jgi:hypothetical protein
MSTNAATPAGTLLLEDHALDLLNGCQVLKEAKERNDIAGTLECSCGRPRLRAICRTIAVLDPNKMRP